MTHEEARTLLERYARGELVAAEAAGVRAHLASGCSPCVAALFGAPTRISGEQIGSGSLARVPADRRVSRVTPVLLCAGVVAVGLMWWQGRAHEGTMLQAVERERQSLRDREAEWRERLDRLDGNRARAEAEAARQEEAAREATEAGVALRRELDQVREQVGIATRDVPGDVRALVVDLLSLPDVQLLPLTPGSPREWMRGHLIWHAGRASGVVYAFGLPPLPSGTFYRARVLVDGGWIENGMAFRPSPRGDVVLPLPIAGLAGQLRGLEIVGEPDGRTVLRGAVDEVEK